MGLDLLQRFSRQQAIEREIPQGKVGHRTRSSDRYEGSSGPTPAALVEEARLRLGQIERVDLPALEGAVRFGNARLAEHARAALGWQIAGVRQAMRDAVAAGGKLSEVEQTSGALETIEARVAHLVVAGVGDEGVTQAVIERAPDIASRLGVPALPVQLDAIGARTARSHRSRGVAQSGVVHLDLAGLTQSDALELLAHEAVHVAQGRLEGEPQPQLAEAEAAFLAHELVSGGSLCRPRHPVASATPMRDDPSAQARHPLPWLTETVLCSLLEQSVAEDNLAAAKGRVETIRAAFASLDAAVRADLHARLARPARGDHLAALFHGRLSSASRQRLLAVLTQDAARTPAQTSTSASTGDRAAASSDEREDTWRAVLGEASTPVGKLGRVEAPLGLRLHAGPSSGTPHTVILPFDTLVHVERKTAHGWYYVVALGGARGGDSVSGTGCVEGQFVELDPPEPTAHLHHVKPGEMLKDIASRYYEKPDGFEWGDDARLYVEAIWEANKGTGKLLRVGGELSGAETLLRSEKLEKTLSIWKSVQPKQGHAIWIPSAAFIASLKKSGAISSGSISNAAWETAKGGMQALVDFLQYGAGFAIGAIEGVYGAFRDLVMGVPDLLVLLYDVAKALFTEGLIGTARSIASKLRDLFEQAPDLLLQAGNWFAKNWNAEDDFDRGKFHGEVIGYVLAQVFILFATMGSSSALLATGRFSGFIKVIQKLDAGADIISFGGRISKKVHVPDAVGDAVRQTHGGARQITAETRARDDALHLDAPLSRSDELEHVGESGRLSPAGSHVASEQGESRFQSRGDPDTSPALGSTKAGIASHLERFRDGGSLLVPESMYKKFIAGKPMLGRPDGLYVTTRSAMDDLLAASGGDLAKIKQRLGIEPDYWNEPLWRIDVTSPLLHNARMPSGMESGANPLFMWGGYTRGGMPEAVLDPVPSSGFVATPTGVNP